MRCQILQAVLNTFGVILVGLTAQIGIGHAETGCVAAVGDIAADACETAVTFTVSVAGEPIDVTIVTDRTIGTAPAQVGSIRAAVEQSAARLSDLELAGFPDITIAVATTLAGDPGDADGATDKSGDDCLIALAGPRLAGDVSLVRHTVAHELFHCAQILMQPTRTDLASSAWWAEGSAEWFANWVYPGSPRSAGFVAEFDAASATTPLTAMDYPTVVFFAWLGQSRGPDAIVDLIRGITGSDDDLANAVGVDGWWQFVDAYFDRTIRWPGGAALPSNPQRGPSITFAAGNRETLEADRYVLYRADMVFEAGYWTLTNNTESGRYHVGAGGQQLPDAIETGCDEPTRYRLRGAGIDPEGFRLTVDAVLEEESACDGCVIAPEFDRCLVGLWQYSSGGPVDWIRNNLGPDVAINMPSMGDPNMRFRAGGTYRAFVTDLHGIVTTDESRGEIEASLVGGGRWSTSGMTLHMCEDMLAPSGTITVETEAINETMALSRFVGPGTALSLDYSCAADLLITELRFPGIPDPIVTNYTRVTPGR